MIITIIIVVMKNPDQERGLASTSTQIDDRLSPGNITVLQGNQWWWWRCWWRWWWWCWWRCWWGRLSLTSTKVIETLVSLSIVSSAFIMKNLFSSRRDRHACLQDLQPWQQIGECFYLVLLYFSFGNAMSWWYQKHWDRSPKRQKQKKENFPDTWSNCLYHTEKTGEEIDGGLVCRG